MTEAGESGPGAGRSLAFPAFAADDGTAEPAIRALLAEAGADPIDVARRLRHVRLLATVLAVAEDESPAGAGEHSIHMAVVSMVNSRGERGLLAFTGVDSLAAWDAMARPVPALGRDVARAARADGARAVVLDVAGPARVVLAGGALDALADEVDLPAATALVHAALAGLTAAEGAEVDIVRGGPGDVADVLVRVGGAELVEASRRDDLAAEAARLLAGDGELGRLVPGGVAVVSG